ncbi:MAG: FHA domain-containing protein [Planctomycetota bacterium]
MRGARLKILKGPGEGSEFYLPIDSRIYVGRGKKCHFRLEDDEASRKHCIIAARPGEYVIRDLDSTYGTLINDYPITKSLLEEDDRLTIGETEIGFNLVDEVPEKFVKIASRSRSELTDSVFEEVSDADMEVSVEEAEQEVAPVGMKYQVLNVKCDDCKRVFYSLRWRPGMRCRACGSTNFNPVISFEDDQPADLLPEEAADRADIPLYKQKVVQLTALIVLGLSLALGTIVYNLLPGSTTGTGVDALYLVPGQTDFVFEEDDGELPPYVSASGKTAFRAYYCKQCKTLFPYGPESGKKEDYSRGFRRPCPNCGEKRDTRKVPALRNHLLSEGVKIWDGKKAVPIEPLEE